jgi:hypothetical protein
MDARNQGLLSVLVYSKFVINKKNSLYIPLILFAYFAHRLLGKNGTMCGCFVVFSKIILSLQAALGNPGARLYFENISVETETVLDHYQ